MKSILVVTFIQESSVRKNAIQTKIHKSGNTMIKLLDYWITDPKVMSSNSWTAKLPLLPLSKALHT